MVEFIHSCSNRPCSPPSPPSPTLSSTSQRVRRLQPLWTELDQLDTDAWVLEPAVGSFFPRLTHRRLALDGSVAVLVELNASHPRESPQIRFTGPDDSVATLRSRVESRLHAWFVTEQSWTSGAESVGLLLRFRCCLCFFIHSLTRFLVGISPPLTPQEPGRLRAREPARRLGSGAETEAGRRRTVRELRRH